MSQFSVTCLGEDRNYAFEPEKTALLVIDMQCHFMSSDDGLEVSLEETSLEEGANAEGVTEPETAEPETAEPDATEEEMIDMREIIPRVVRLLAKARELGCHVVHTREGYSPDLGDVTSFRHELGYVGHESPLGRTLIRGEPGHDFVEELQPLPGETVIDKASFGAFCRTDLDDQLRAAGVTHLILCGVTTQCCVHSTLREAVDLGYWCLTIADCCAASEPGLHEAALMLIAGEGHLFGWVADLSDIEGQSEAAVA